MNKSIQELFSLKGKVAIVTGGAMGIGKSIAARLAEAGASIILTDINPQAARDTVDEMISSGYKVTQIQADSSNLEDIDRVIEQTLDTYGDLHILVNNAGVYPFCPAVELTEKIWDRTIGINLKGVMFFSRAVAKTMVAHNHGGKIINLASIDAFHPSGNIAHYDASKGGVVMLTKALALEWAPKGILVNAVAPGAVQTPGAQSIDCSQMTQEQIAALFKDFLKHIPLGRQGVPDDIAKVALFLASEASDYLVGTTIVADGGYLIGS